MFKSKSLHGKRYRACQRSDVTGVTCKAFLLTHENQCIQNDLFHGHQFKKFNTQAKVTIFLCKPSSSFLDPEMSSRSFIQLVISVLNIHLIIYISMHACFISLFIHLNDITDTNIHLVFVYALWDNRTIIHLTWHCLLSSDFYRGVNKNSQS